MICVYEFCRSSSFRFLRACLRSDLLGFEGGMTAARAVVKALKQHGGRVLGPGWSRVGGLADDRPTNDVPPTPLSHCSLRRGSHRAASRRHVTRSGRRRRRRRRHVSVQAGAADCGGGRPDRPTTVPRLTCAPPPVHWTPTDAPGTAPPAPAPASAAGPARLWLESFGSAHDDVLAGPARF